MELGLLENVRYDGSEVAQIRLTDGAKIFIKKEKGGRLFLKISKGEKHSEEEYIYLWISHDGLSTSIVKNGRIEEEYSSKSTLELLP